MNTSAKLSHQERLRLLSHPDSLANHIADVLFEYTSSKTIKQLAGTPHCASVVLFLLQDPVARGDCPHLVLNKRSRAVPQSGDLCCPGGGNARIDRWLAPTTFLPFMPLHRYPLKKVLPSHSGLSSLVATALREAFEEMRLLPFGITFLGLLPIQPLKVLNRSILPVVARIQCHPPLIPNWEVDAVVPIALNQLLNPDRYARLRVRFAESQADTRIKNDLICFRHKDQILWGATFQIVQSFLRCTFGFSLPPIHALPLKKLTLSKTYLTGSGRH